MKIKTKTMEEIMEDPTVELKNGAFRSAEFPDLGLSAPMASALLGKTLEVSPSGRRFIDNNSNYVIPNFIIKDDLNKDRLIFRYKDFKLWEVNDGETFCYRVALEDFYEESYIDAITQLVEKLQQNERFINDKKVIYVPFENIYASGDFVYGLFSIDGPTRDLLDLTDNFPDLAEAFLFTLNELEGETFK